MKVIECDVLVVGGGVAAVSAVKNALPHDVNICLAVKGSFGCVGLRGAGASSCGTTEGGRPRLPDVSGVEYDPETFYHQVIQAGLGVTDRTLVSTMVEDIPNIRKQLHKWGVVFGGKGPVGLGYPMIRAVEHDIRASGIQLFERTMITDLIIHDGQCAGAIGVTENGRIFVFKTPAIVLATGGNARLFQHNVHPDGVTGDGYAMAFRAGARVMNMEFMQIFFCTVYPTRNLFHVWKDLEELRNISNAEGHPFLADYLPDGISIQECVEENLRHAPFSTRDRASRYLGIGMVKEIQAGRGTPFGGVVLDLRHSNTMFPKAQEDFLRYKGIDIRTSLIQLTMGHQCSNGGLCIDTNAMTDVPGVFAAGEVTAGMHGADRIGGNMLTSCLVFGARAGNAAASWAKAHKVSDDILQTARVKVDKIRAIASSTGRTSPESLLQTLQKSAWNHALTVRSEKSLMMMLFDIQQFLHEFSSSLAVSTPADLIHALELRNLLLVGELVAKSALQRRESRGGHYREDYPECDYQSPSQAIILQQAQGQIIQVTETVIDPDWRYDDNDLGQERWG